MGGTLGNKWREIERKLKNQRWLGQLERASLDDVWRVLRKLRDGALVELERQIADELQRRATGEGDDNHE